MLVSEPAKDLFSVSVVRGSGFEGVIWGLGRVGVGLT
jgi:hypothetical protein